MDLTYKQRQFVAYYLGVSAGNAADAARRAGYKCPDKQGPQQLAKTRVRAAIDAKLDETALASDEILARLSEIATGGIQDFVAVDDAGQLTIDFKRARKRGKLGLLRKLKPSLYGMGIETHDPVKALELLGKYRGLWDGKATKPRGEDPPTLVLDFDDTGTDEPGPAPDA